MSTLMEEIEHNILKLEDEGYSIIIEHDELNMGVQQEFEVGDNDKIVRNEDGVFTMIDMGLGIGVGVELDSKEALNRELSESVEKLTHFLTTVLEEPIDVLHDHMYFSSDAGMTVRDNMTLYDIEFVLPEVIVPQNEFLSWLGFGEKWLVMWLS